MMAREIVDQIVRLRGFPSEHKDTLPQSVNLFVYCSTPRAVLESNISGGQYGRPMYRDNVSKPKGVHSYYNISWDPRVRRGDPLQARKRREQLECEKIRKKLIEPRKRSDKSISKEDKKAARLSDPQTMIRTANMRYARLAISNLRPKEKDAFLVELTDELDQDEICYKGQRIGAAKVLPKVPSRKRNLIDKASQIWPGDFFDFDKEVVPILERLVGSICDQARREVLEETEAEALELERELFMNNKRKEERELLKYKMRVEKHRAEEERQTALARDQAKKESHGDIGVSLYAGVYVKYSVDEGLQALGEDWQLNNKIHKAVKSDVVSWLNTEVDNRVALFYSANKLFDDMIHQVVSEREAQCAAAMWKEVYSEDPVRVFPEDTESNRVPPPTPGTSDYTTDEEEALGFPSTPNYFGEDYDMTEE